MMRGNLSFFSRAPLTMASMMLGWSEPRFTKQCVTPASHSASKKAKEVVYMLGGAVDNFRLCCPKASGDAAAATALANPPLVDELKLFRAANCRPGGYATPLTGRGLAATVGFIVELLVQAG